MTREEAIKEIKNWNFLNETEYETIKTIFPELEVSEDEKTRKEIIDFLNNQGASLKYNYAKWIEYLEKQKQCQEPFNINFASKWLNEHVASYLNWEYNEFHRSVEYDGTINKTAFINDFEQAMKKEMKISEIGDTLIGIAEGLEGYSDKSFNGYSGHECAEFLKNLAKQSKK